ncbi:MAG: DUF5007 domain-containing protein [Dysgonamonadaceae bacterium]|jgi:hypothetical protein|nr:DUF5007 domain-containing protein [Dysgonamonadaceae bacterium]
MKKYIYSFLLLPLLLASCFDQPEGVGFLSEAIYLKEADTIYISLGGKAQTDFAWLDNSSLPCTFTIENIRDKNGNRSEQFFEELPYRTWKAPYNFETDKTEEAIMAKLSDLNLPPLMINPVNGQLLYMETTTNLKNPGDVFHMDVRVTNSSGSKVFPDYAILKLSTEKYPYRILEITNGISVVRNGSNNFALYDQINGDPLSPNFEQRRQNIYDDNGKEFVRIQKISDEPAVGIKFIVRMEDSKGKLFAPEEYITYAGTYSYIDVSINRKNTSEGMEVEFPLTPWPAYNNSYDYFYNYLRGPTFNNFNFLDINKLRDDVFAGKAPSLVGLADWPENNWADATAWFVRLRSRVRFEEAGTWKMTIKVPYTSLDGIF